MFFVCFCFVCSDLVGKQETLQHEHYTMCNVSFLFCFQIHSAFRLALIFSRCLLDKSLSRSPEQHPRGQEARSVITRVRSFERGDSSSVVDHPADPLAEQSRPVPMQSCRRPATPANSQFEEFCACRGKPLLVPLRTKSKQMHDQ